MLHCNNNEERDRCKVNLKLKSSTYLSKNYNLTPGYKIKTWCKLKGQIITSQKKNNPLSKCPHFTDAQSHAGFKGTIPSNVQGKRPGPCGVRGRSPKNLH